MVIACTFFIVFVVSYLVRSFCCCCLSPFAVLILFLSQTASDGYEKHLSHP